MQQQVVRSDASTPAKIGWGLGVALFPVLGTLLWLCMGPRPSDMEADWASQKAWMGTQVYTSVP